MLHQDHLSTLEIGVDHEEKPQQVVCYRSRDDTWGLDMEKKRKIEGLKHAYLFFLHMCFNNILD